MATEGFLGLYVETRNYGATAAFWSSLGFEPAFETGHGSGQWEHPGGGPYVFINEQHGSALSTYPILGVADADASTFNAAANCVVASATACCATATCSSVMATCCCARATCC